MQLSSQQISGSTNVVGILGWPVSHSLSPLMHNAAFQKLRLNFTYIPLPCPPDQLEKAISGLRAMGIKGANVTIPHKEAVIPFLDRLTPIAEKMQTVNTLFWENGELVGTTTDPYGALANLRASGYSPNNQPLLIVGTGGAARALSFAFALDYPQMPLTFAFRAEDQKQAEKLIAELKEKSEATIQLLPLSQLSSSLSKFNLIINATPVGMHPLEDKTPFDTSLLLSGQWVYDIVYTPRETRLLRDAKNKGCHAVEGLGMLLHQGAKSFQFWTGREAPIEVMAAALNLE